MKERVAEGWLQGFVLRVGDDLALAGSGFRVFGDLARPPSCSLIALLWSCKDTYFLRNAG